MTRPSSPTRELLYRAGLRRFAEDGWTTARVRDVVADAGQANDSAVNYHFGSRQGLLEEILRRGVDRMEDRRAVDLDRVAEGATVEDLVDVVVRPLTDLLVDDEGRWFLRIVGQVGAFAQVGDTLDAGPVAGTAVQREVELLLDAVAAEVGEGLARSRVRRLVLMLTAIAAVRAAETPADGPDPDEHASFVDDLVVTLAAGLVARPRAVTRPR